LSDYENALWGHDIGRAYEHDDLGNQNGKLHPYLSYENSGLMSDVARIAILNHTYTTAADMYEKMNSREVASQAKGNPKDIDWMSELQLDAFGRFQKLSEDKKIATLLVSNMLRDADKLGNWKGLNKFGHQEETPTMRKIYDSAKGREGTFSLAESEMNAMRDGRLLKYFEDITNFNGMNLAVLMWIHDMALTSTKNAAANPKSNLALGLVNYMDEYAQQMAVSQNNPAEYKKFLTQLYEVFENIKKHGFIAEGEQFGRISRENRLADILSGKLKVPTLTLDGIKKYKGEKDL